MKKINIKKLNQFYSSNSNADQIKHIVSIAVENFTSNTGAPNVQYISILNDLGLLLDM